MSTVAIMGGEGRLGRVLCGFFAELGLQVVSLDYRKATSQCSHIQFIQCDLMDPQTFPTAVESALLHLGHVDYVVTALRYRDTTDSEYLSMVREFQVQVAGPHTLIESIRLAQQPQVLRSVVHVSSVLAAFSSSQESVAYTTAKGALESLVRKQALDWGRSGTSVNGVAPGFIDYGLDMRSAQHLNSDTTALSNAVEATLVLDRPASPLSLCRTIYFLLGSDGITGQIVRVDAGSSTLEPLGVALKSV